MTTSYHGSSKALGVDIDESKPGKLNGNEVDSLVSDEQKSTANSSGEVPSLVIKCDKASLSRSGENLEEFDSVSVLSSYSGEWEKLFTRPNYFENLQNYGMQGRLRSSRFRSVCWRLYLGVLPANQSEWLATTRQWRSLYDELRKLFITNPRAAMESSVGVDISKNNPLSLETESPWNQYFKDKELRVTILQDVVRTFPDVEFFRDKQLHERMVDILFCVARHRAYLAYKQGMHELLAPMIFVLHCDHQAFLHASEIGSVSGIDAAQCAILTELLDPQYLEHDAFAMFCCVMDRLTEWYVSRDNVPVNDPFTAQPFSSDHGNGYYNPSNVITSKLSYIQDDILAAVDPELKAYLELLDIPPQIYGIRWLRLLFGREFPMQDLLVLWDAIFADGLDHDLVDYLFVSLLVFLREIILTSDYSSCLLLLMRFPAIGDVHHFIEKALYLRDPSRHSPPPTYVYQGNKMQGDASPRVQRSSRAPLSVQLGGGFSFMSQLSTSLTRRFNSTTTSASGQAVKKSYESVHSTLTDAVGDGPPAGMAKKQSASSVSLSLLATHTPLTVQPGHRRSFSHQNMSLMSHSDTGIMGDVTHSQDHSTCSSEVSSSSFEDVSVEESLVMLRQEENSTVDEPEDLGLGYPNLNSKELEGRVIEPGGSGHSSGSGQAGDSVAGRRDSRTASGRDGGGSGRQGKGKEEELQVEVGRLMARLQDFHILGLRCAHLMDQHIGKLQAEMLRQQLHTDDDVLLSVVALKQVRDILQGTLEPSELFGDKVKDTVENIVICEDHFTDNPVNGNAPHALIDRDNDWRRGLEDDQLRH